MIAGERWFRLKVLIEVDGSSRYLLRVTEYIGGWNVDQVVRDWKGEEQDCCENDIAYSDLYLVSSYKWSLAR